MNRTLGATFNKPNLCDKLREKSTIFLGMIIEMFALVYLAKQLNTKYESKIWILKDFPNSEC